MKFFLVEEEKQKIHCPKVIGPSWQKDFFEKNMILNSCRVFIMSNITVATSKYGDTSLKSKY